MERGRQQGWPGGYGMGVSDQVRTIRMLDQA